MFIECEKCGRKRSDGWLLIDGLCAHHGPEGFRLRRSELQIQAAQLIEADRSEA